MMTRGRLLLACNVACGVIASFGCGTDDSTSGTATDAGPEANAGKGGSAGHGKGGAGAGGAAAGTAGVPATGGAGATSGAAGAAGTAATGGVAGTAGANPGGSGGSATCPTLAQRVRTTNIALAGTTVVSTPMDSFTQEPPVQVSVSSTGLAYVGWLGNDGNVHVTPLDTQDARAGSDLTALGSDLRGFVAVDDGVALLTRHDQALDVVKLTLSGQPVFERRVVQGGDPTAEGMTSVGTYGHNGRVSWSGQQFATYLGHTRNWGSSGDHQGDMLKMLSPSGEVESGGWDWGCSHSDDVRLAFGAAGVGWGAVCVSDGYPGKGIYFNNATQLFPDSEITSVYIPTQLGGLVPSAGSFFLNFASKEGRASHDIALLQVSGGAPAGTVMWLQDTPATEELNPHLASYHSNFLVAWSESPSDLYQTTLAIVSPQGALLAPAATIPARTQRSADFVNFGNGDVGWAYADAAGTQLSIVRVQACDP